MQNATSALQIQQYTSACRAWMNSLSSWPGLWKTQLSLDDFELGGGIWRKVSFGYLNACESVSHSAVFHCLEPHRQPAMLLCPWNSPGKNTGVGSHSLLQGILLT